MKKLLLLVVLVGAVHHFKPGLFSFIFSNGAFDSEGNPEVLVFTSNSCGDFCNKGILELKRRKVRFKELPLDDNEEHQKLYDKLGPGVLPYTVSGYQKAQGFDPAMIVSALAENYGDRYLTRAEKGYYKNHFNADGSPRIYMYGASWCGYTKKMREEFANRDMDYLEIDVEKASDRASLVSSMQIDGYPLIYVGYRRIPGADINKVIEAKKLAISRKV